MVYFFARLEGNDAALCFFAVYDQAADSFFCIFGIPDFNFIVRIPETAGDTEIAESFGNAGIDGQTVILGLDSQNILGDIYKGPGSCAGQPAVFGLPVEFRVCAGHHLGVDIGLCAVNLADVLDIGGTGFAVYPMTVSAMEIHGLL